VVDDIAHWRDRHTPPEDSRNPLIDDHPYLGPGFEFLGRTPQGAARVRGLFGFNYSALPSAGLSAAALSGMRAALPRLVRGVTHQLFEDDCAEILAGFHAFAEPEFHGEWPLPK
jgi:hypothetical protein